MPCVVTEAEARWYETEANKDVFGVAATSQEILTEVACEATRLLAEGKTLKQGSKLLKRWYETHRASDKKAEKEAKNEAQKIELKKAAMKKLSAAEISALGLK